MHINWQLPGWVWVKTTAEAAGVAFALSLYDAWQSTPSHDVTAIPWSHALGQGGYFAAGIVLYGIAGLGRKNGVWSWVKDAGVDSRK